MNGATRLRDTQATQVRIASSDTHLSSAEEAFDDASMPHAPFSWPPRESHRCRPVLLRSVRNARVRRPL